MRGVDCAATGWQARESVAKTPPSERSKAQSLADGVSTAGVQAREGSTHPSAQAKRHGTVGADADAGKAACGQRDVDSEGASKLRGQRVRRLDARRRS